MALPASYNTVNVRGKFVDLAGDPVKGQLTFTPTTLAMQAPDDLTTVIGRALKVNLDNQGAFSINLPATDDPDIDPTGFTYTVVEKFEGLTGRTYSIAVPIAMAGVGIELATAVPSTPTSGVVRAYRLSELGDVAAAGAPGDVLTLQADGSWAASDDLSGALAAKADAAATTTALAAKLDTTVASGTYLSQAAARYGTKVAGLTLGNAIDTTIAQTDVVDRRPVRLPVTTSRWRLHVRNSGSDGAGYAGVFSYRGVYFGRHSRSSVGAMTGNFTAAPVSALGAFTTPADGSEYVSGWVTDASLQFQENVEHLLSFGWTCPAATTMIRTSTQSWVDYGAAGKSLMFSQQTIGSTASISVGWMHYWIEYEYVGAQPTGLAVTDSIGDGYLGTNGALGTWPHLVAVRNGTPILAIGITGSKAADWTSAVLYRWTRWGIGTSLTAPTFGIVALGGNDIYNGVAVATVQANIKTVMDNVRALGATKVYVATITPRTSGDATNNTNRIALNAWMRTLPNGAAGCFSMEKVTLDPAAPNNLDAEFNSGDNVHLTAAGYARMVEAVPGRLA